RPPRGMLVGASVRRAHEQGQGVALWTVTRGPNSIGAGDVDGVRRALVDSIHPGAAIDLHDRVGASRFGGPHHHDRHLHRPHHSDRNVSRRRDAELQALPAAIEAWQAAGYRFVTLSELATPAADGAAPVAPPALR